MITYRADPKTEVSITAITSDEHNQFFFSIFNQKVMKLTKHKIINGQIKTKNGTYINLKS